MFGCGVEGWWGVCLVVGLVFCGFGVVDCGFGGRVVLVGVVEGGVK